MWFEAFGTDAIPRYRILGLKVAIFDKHVCEPVDRFWVLLRLVALLVWIGCEIEKLVLNIRLVEIANLSKALAIDFQFPSVLQDGKML